MESFRSQLTTLVELFGSNRRAAAFLGVSHSQLSGWLGKAVPSAKNLQRIVDATAVVKALRDAALDNDQVLTELASTWPELGHRRPSELVRASAAIEVVAAAGVRYAVSDSPTVPVSSSQLAETLRALAAAAAASAAALTGRAT